MVLTPSNYRFYYGVRDRMPFKTISVEMTDEFVEYLRNLEINKNIKDRYDQIALGAMKNLNVSKSLIKSAKSSGVCKWDKGLLTQILIPYGSACGLILDNTESWGYVYLSHNVDADPQASVILAVITKYLSDMDFGIKDLSTI